MRAGTYLVFGIFQNGKQASYWITTGKRVDRQVIEKLAKDKSWELDSEVFIPTKIQREW